MPQQRAIAGVITRVDLPVPPDPAASYKEKRVNMRQVHLDDGSSAWLNPQAPGGAPLAEMLRDLQEARIAAYLTLNDDDYIVNLIIPIRGRVQGVEEDDDGSIHVLMEGSAGRHVISPDNPDRDELLAALQAARETGVPILMAEIDPDHEIIDVRPEGNGPGPAEHEYGFPSPALAPEVHLIPQVIDEAKALELFNLAKSESCHPNAPVGLCIPFLFPDDGCYARAHQMCRLFLTRQVKAAKIWIFSSKPGIAKLRVDTQNHPYCKVYWAWHVAPTVLVSVNGHAQERVLDPAIFAGPVTAAEWKAAMHNPGATLQRTTMAVYIRNHSGQEVETDVDFRKTEEALQYWDEALKNRSTTGDGPPPYAHC